MHCVRFAPRLRFAEFMPSVSEVLGMTFPYTQLGNHWRICQAQLGSGTPASTG